MPNCIVTGKIYFSRALTDEQLTELSFFLTQSAINNRIGLNLYSNLTADGLSRYPLYPYDKDGYIPYEIVDNPLATECFRVFFGITYSSKNWSIASLDRTQIPAIQSFLETSLRHEWISSMTMDFEDVHGAPIRQIFEREIQANQLCQTLIDAPNEVNHFSVPAVRLKIIG